MLTLMLGIGQMWATLPTNPTWEAKALADIADGSTLVIISNSDAATNIAMPSTTTTSSGPAKKACTVSTTDGVTTITPPSGTTLQDLAWTIEKKSSTWKFWQEGSTTVRLYLTGLSSNTAVRVSNANSSNDEFTMGTNGKLLKVSTGGRYVGPNDNGGTDWRSYNSETASNYKGAQLTFYVLRAPEPTLSSITVATAPTTLTYTEGDFFDPTGLVINANYDNSTSTAVDYAAHSSEFSFSPSLTTALATTDTKVTITWGEQSVDQTITVNPAGGCTNTVAVTKGTETNGTYTFSATEVCGDGDGGTVFITNITPAEGYELDDITATVGTVDKENNKVTGITANTTITVTFKELPKYTVSFNVGGSAASQADITETSYGAGITLPAGPTPTCSADGWTFAGWATAAVAEQTTTAPALLAAGANYKPSADCTLFAVYKKSGGETEITDVITSANLAATGTSYTAFEYKSTTSNVTYHGASAKTAANSRIQVNTTAPRGIMVKANPDGLKLKSVAVTFSTTGNNETTSDGRYFDIYGKEGNFTDLSSWENIKSGATKIGTITYKTGTASYTQSCATPYNYTGFATVTLGGAQYYENLTFTWVVSAFAYHSNPYCCEKHSITIADNIEHGSVEADLAQACEGTEVTLTATPNDHCRFVSWSVNNGDVTVTDNKFSMPDADVTVSATFEEIKNAVTVADNIVGGSVEVTGADDLTSVLEGTALTVTATPNAENHYIGGTIKVVKTGVTPEADVTNVVLSGSTLTMPDYAITISATFTPTYEIKIVADGGSVALEYTKNGAADGYALEGTEIMATASASAGYTFKSLSLSENAVDPEIADEMATFTMPAEAVTITALFDEVLDPVISGVPTEDISFPNARQHGTIVDQTFTLTGANLTSKLTLSATGGFTVSPEEITPEAGAVNQLITLSHSTEVADDFVGTLTISGGGLAADATVDLLLTVTPTYLVQIAVNDANMGSATLNGGTAAIYVDAADELALVANPAEGYQFVEWTLSADNILITDAEAASTTANTIVGAVTITANFELIPTYTAKWYVNGSELAESAQTAEAGTTLTVPADPSATGDCEGLVFKGWLTYELEKASATAPEGLITETEGLTMPSNDINYYAVFAEEDATDPSTVVDNIDYSFTAISGSGYQAWSSKTGTSGAVYAGQSCVNANSYIQLRKQSPSAIITTGTGSGKATKVTITWGAGNNAGRSLAVYGKNSAYAETADMYDNTKYGTLLGSISVDSSDPLVITDEYDYIGLLASAPIYIENIAIEWNVPGSTVYSNFVTTCPSCGTVTLSAASVEHGSIALSKESVKTCEAAEVTVTATPDPGYELDDIELSGVAGATYSQGVISIPQDAEGTLIVTATFSAVNYTVAVAQTGGAGSELSGATDAAHYGEEITVSATAVDGYYFIGWEATGITLENAQALSQTFNMPANNVSLTAKFTKILSVADAIKAIDAAGTTINDQVIEAYISSVESFSSQYSSITYWIKDIDENGFLTGTAFEAYSGKGLDGAAFSSIDDIVVGAKVRIFGSIKYYSNDDVYEFNYNNYQLAYTAPENASVEIYGTAAKTAYEVGDSFEFDGLSAKTAYDNKYATAIENPTWAAVPATIAANTTSVSVTANGEGAKNIDITVLTHELSISATNGTVVVKYQGAAVEAGDHFVKGDVLTITATPASADYALTSLTVNDVDFVSGDTYEVGTTDIVVEATFTEKSAAGISWSESAVNVTLGDTYVLPTLNNPNSLTVELSSTNEAVAYLDEGQIKIAGAGETTISAEFAGNDTHKASTVSYTLTVANPASYSLKNNWNGGEWEWAVMTYAGDGEYILENVVFGGTGVNWRQGDSGDGTWVELASFGGDNIQAWDNVTLALDPSAGTITATLNSRAVVEFGGSWTSDWSEGKITAVVSTDNTYAAVKKELTKGEWYNFKPIVGGHWLGCSAGATGINRTSNSVHGFVYQDGDNHIYFQADVTGEYEFKWVYTTNTVIVTFPDHTYTVAWSLAAGPDETLGELEKMGDSDIFAKYFEKDILSVGTYVVKVFQDEETTPITTANLEISEVAKYYVEFDYDASKNELSASATYQGTPTGVDETGDGQKAVKVMKDNTIYIIRGDKTYTITGQVVR